ncbi:hypothetical protein D6856_13985 [Butyrivibrio sp. XB500-5]|uniref:EsaB/YukD family protein n=1 Tax=Butyrivibrio sp. XB500-5 TaxID=2364880 RepID=UPI000EAAB002|nr:EsaB/YukD family protein [Butyrivibrio sp. XB500-5]RKM57761.1 hypothetical protein D6856_13985 [Butyrivibrio sp. XB500-5]
MDNKAIIIFKSKKNETGIDIEIPLNISANELIYGLNQGIHLGINMDDPEQCYLRMENPIGFLRGDTMLNEYGIRNGSVIYVE